MFCLTFIACWRTSGDMEHILIILLNQVIRLNRKLWCALFWSIRRRYTIYTTGHFKWLMNTQLLNPLN